MEEKGLAVGIGDQDEMRHFVETYRVFMEKHAVLDALRDKVFQRQGMGKLFDIALYALGRVCSEDFQQVFVLCGNGFGIGAMQIVRGMYERHVTATYLLNHQDELEQFLEYDKVHRSCQSSVCEGRDNTLTKEWLYTRSIAYEQNSVPATRSLRFIAQGGMRRQLEFFQVQSKVTNPTTKETFQLRRLAVDKRRRH